MKNNERKQTVATLTLPLHRNYGAIIQAYALQKTIMKLGYDSKIINLRNSVALDCKSSLLYATKDFIKRKLLGRHIISKKFDDFVEQELAITSVIWNQRQLNSIGKKFDSYVVGSDQVWRSKYVPGISNYFLSFVDEQAKKIAYAASFGNEILDYNKSEVRKCGVLLESFSFASVRERSGLDLCKKNFNADVEFVIDPTFLLKRSDYDSLILDYKNEVPPSQVFSYVLDVNNDKLNYINGISNALSVISNMCTLGVGKDEVGPVDWLYNIKNCEYFITDSFHGMVFALIFEKQFFVIVNNERGASRFESLANELGIEGRILDEKSSFPKFGETPEINYDLVNKRIETFRLSSLDKLSKALSE